MSRAVISAAVEGPLDEAVLQRLVLNAGALLGTVYGKKGKQHLLDKIGGYNAAAQHNPWIVLIDLDSDGPCVGSLRQTWLPHPAPYMCFRVAVKEVEAWLLADRENVAAFLGVALSKVPLKPDTEPDPKLTIVNLARGSRKRDIREGLVARPGSGRVVGPAYTSYMIEYVATSWHPEAAIANSPSLGRCLICIQRLVSNSP